MVRLAAVACGLACLVLSSAVHAQTASTSERSVARDLGYSGIEAFQAGQFEVASERLEKAYAVLHVPSLGLWSARALVKQGKLVEAADRYAEVARIDISSGDEAVQKKAQADAQTELEETRKTLPGVLIRVQGAAAADVSLRIDGAPVSKQLLGELTPLNPGEHVVEVTVGTHVQTRRFSVTLGVRKELTFKSASQAGGAEVEEHAVQGDSPGSKARAPDSSKPASRGSLQRTLGWVSVGVGAAGVAAGAITGALVLGRESSLKAKPGCEDGTCPNELSSDVSSYNTLRTVSTTAFIAGGALSALGVVLVLSTPKAEQQTALRVSPSFVELEYRFQ